MGVQGLWQLLNYSGRQIEIGNLEGQRIAIDVSIWLLRILYGVMANAQQTELSKNLYLLYIFKRIVRMLELGIRPVFVFDGRPPEIKRETLRMRQEIREKRLVNVQKIAERYIVRSLERSLLQGRGAGGAVASEGAKE